MLNELAGRRFAKLGLAHWFWIAGAVLLITAGLFWWFGVQTQPKRVFNDMLEQSLMTNGVTVQAEQASEGGSIAYWLQYSLGSTNQARSLTKISQNNADITTEVLGTNDYDYTRYASIETSQTDKDGKPLDVGNIQNVWAKGQSSLLAESALGLSLPLGALPVPIGNITPEKRGELLDFMRQKKVYDVDYGNVETKRQDGRLQYVYNVKVQVILYADLLKRFAQSAGLNDLDTLDPNTYSGAEPIDLKLTVDVRSRHVVGVDVTVSETQNYSYTYGSYDVPLSNEIPQETIADTELQKRIGELSGNEE